MTDPSSQTTTSGESGTSLSEEQRAALERIEKWDNERVAVVARAFLRAEDNHSCSPTESHLNTDGEN